MPRLRDGLLPALILSLLLLQYAAVGHVLAHMGLGHQGWWAGAPITGDNDPAEDPGGCEAPQLHAVIDGTPLASPPAAVLIDVCHAAHASFLLAVADRTAPRPYSRGPPFHSL